MYIYDFVDYEFDSNGDGYPDTYVEAYDTTGDGIYDTMAMYSDTDGDGYADAITTSVDSDSNGQYDTFQQILIAEDGAVEAIQRAYDYNQDGQIDSAKTYLDTDHNGVFDTLVKEHDDKVEVFIDPNESGRAEYHELYAYDPTTGMLVPAMADGIAIGGTLYNELPNFEPDINYPSDTISGDPVASMEHWEYQGDTNRCALYSQKFVIEELSPNINEIDIEEFANIAKEHGWFSEDGGTTLLNMNNMLDYYGIENEMTFNNSIEDIEACLNKGGKVIVSIDSCEIWYGEDDNMFSPDSCSNHAVEVIGIDRTDPEHPMVILNDSGTPNGRGEMIPLDVFKGAWEDGDYQMISCYPHGN